MKGFSKLLFVCFLTVSIVLLEPVHSIAQPRPVPPPVDNGHKYDLGEGPDPCTDPFAYCPIDSGILFLLAAGIGYGLLQMKNSRKKQVAERG